MTTVPEKEFCCKSEFVEFKMLLDRIVSRRGKRREKHIQDLDKFFCDKIYEVMLRQKGYFKEILNREKELQLRLESVINENMFLENTNHKLRQTLASKDVFLHNLEASTENAS
jgi:hypothetical protein